MLAKARITKRTVDATKGSSQNTLLWDEEVSGFGLKVTPVGRKVYIYQYRLALPGQARSTPPRRYTIGQHGELTPEQARDRAKQLRSLVEQGIDPVDQKRGTIAASEEAKRAAAERYRLEGEWKFEAVAERWLAHLLTEKKSVGYYRTSRWVVRHYLAPALVGRPLPHIKADDVQAVIGGVPAEKRETRLSVFDTAFAIFKWAKGTAGGRIVVHNVVEDVDRPKKPGARERMLADSELALVWLTCDQLTGPWPSLYRLAILTGKRRSELGQMDWSEFDRDAREWIIAKERAKNRNPDLVPLSEPVVAELDALALAAHRRAGTADAQGWPKSGPVLTANGSAPIGNYSKIKRALDDALSAANDGSVFANWTLHDLRRTFASGMQRLNVRFEVTEALLAHTGRARGGVAGIYQRHDWKPEKREAMERWAVHVAQVVAAHTSPNVIPMQALRA